MYFKFDADGSIVCADERKIYPDMVFLSLPDGFSFDYVGEWRYKDGEWMHTPSDEPPPQQPTQAERIAALEEELRAAKILLGLEV